MAAYAHESTYIPRRMVVFAAIVVFHVFLVWGLANGLARQVVEVLAPPIETDLIDEQIEDEAPPPPPPPEMERPPVEVPPPEVNIVIPQDAAPTTAISNVTDRPVPVAPPPVKRAGTPAKLDVKRSPATDDFYPPSSRRAEEEGVVTVRVCSNPEGRVAGTPTVAKGSGFEKLDEAAVKWAQRARFIPGTEDGKPVESCTQFNVRFKLTN
jgi:protein TonB